MQTRKLKKMRAGRIPELFEDGEDVFREAESATVLRLAALQGKVLAMGGGVVLRPENITRLHRTGGIIFLDRAPADIIKDVDTTTRPLLLAAGRERVLTCMPRGSNCTWRQPTAWCRTGDR
jgi:shikimate kinase